MNILEMQEAILADGWRFTETTFNDGSGDTYIELSQTQEGFIGLGVKMSYDKHGNSLPLDEVGWGRYPRQQAWEKAYQYIIVEKRHLVGKRV